MKRAKRANPDKPKTARKPPGGSNHKLVPVMPEGSILTDLMKKQWKLGKPVGSGGFGMIYLTQQNSSSPVKEAAEFVMKLEPVDNGPLFCELHFYMRAAKPEMIKEWKKTYGMKSLGVPEYIASGQQEVNGTKIRFMVMQRFGNDLQKVFEQNGKQFPAHTVFLLGLELIDALEYIHDKGYTHADIKAANLMTGYKDPNQVYLIDYGLAFRFMQDGKHKEYKEDPRKAHDGTVEFTSRDAHKGVAPSRRGDLEILAYCMLQWLCQKLPWENNLQNKDYVRDQKIRYMADIPTFLNVCLHGKSVPAEFGKYLTYVSQLKYEEKPSYDRCRELFSAALKKLGHKETDKLDFVVKKVKTSKHSDTASSPVTPTKNRKRASSSAVRELSASPLLGSPSVDEEAAEPSARKRRKLPSQSPPARKPRPAGPKKPGQTSGAGDLTAANSIPSSSRNPIVIAAKKSINGARKSISASGKGGRRPTASRPKKSQVARVVSSIGTQTSPGLRGMPRGRVLSIND